MTDLTYTSNIYILKETSSKLTVISPEGDRLFNARRSIVTELRAVDPNIGTVFGLKHIASKTTESR